jgi:hypothetical protein
MISTYRSIIHFKSQSESFGGRRVKRDKFYAEIGDTPPETHKFLRSRWNAALCTGGLWGALLCISGRGNRTDGQRTETFGGAIGPIPTLPVLLYDPPGQRGARESAHQATPCQILGGYGCGDEVPDSDCVPGTGRHSHSGRCSVVVSPLREDEASDGPCRSKSQWHEAKGRSASRWPTNENHRFLSGRLQSRE